MLLVPRAVQKEVARLKSDGNSRRAKRARKAASLLMRVAQSTTESEVVCEADPRVELCLSGFVGLDSAAREAVDIGQVDDRIIAEIQEFGRKRPGTKVAMLTTDSDQVVSCKALGIRFLAVPDEWLLPPELDERDKRIRELTDRVEQLEATEPEISVSWEKGEAKIDRLHIELREPNAFSEADLEKLVQEASCRRPMPKDLDDLVKGKHTTQTLEGTMLAGTGMRYRPPTQRAVAHYRETAYPNWLVDVRTFFERFPKAVGRQARIDTVDAVVRNDGSRPAEGTIVTFTALGGLLLLRGKKESSVPHFPKPPDPPKGSYVQSALGMPGAVNLKMPALGPSIGFSHREPARDAYTFYLTKGEPSRPCEQWIYECEQFRHAGHREVFHIGLFVPEGLTPANPAIRCEVFAKNMSSPIERVLAVSLTAHTTDPKAAAYEVIERNLGPPPVEISFDL